MSAELKLLDLFRVFVLSGTLGGLARGSRFAFRTALDDFCSVGAFIAANDSASAKRLVRRLRIVFPKASV